MIPRLVGLLPRLADLIERFQPPRMTVEIPRVRDPKGVRRQFLLVRVVNTRRTPLLIEGITLQLSNNRYIFQGKPRALRTQRRGTPVIMLVESNALGLPEFTKSLGTNEPFEAYFELENIRSDLLDASGEVVAYADRAIAVDSLDKEWTVEVPAHINRVFGAHELAERAREPHVRRKMRLGIAIKVIGLAIALVMAYLAVRGIGRLVENEVDAPVDTILESAPGPALSIETRPKLTETDAPMSTLTVTASVEADATPAVESSQTASRVELPAPSTTSVMGPDEAVLVFVPGGELMMGSSSTLSVSAEEEVPLHTVEVQGFWIDLHEITNSRFGLCVRARQNAGDNSIGCGWHPEKGPVGELPYFGSVTFANYPVVNVSWFDAVDYCTWAGRRLPTESEWEYAARGEGASPYPWDGETATSIHADFKYGQSSDSQPSAVGSFQHGASKFGVLDVAGNVWEWTSDWFDAYPDSPYDNPRFGETHKSVRGGSFASFAWDLRTARRRGVAPDLSELDLGFRCAASVVDS